MALFDSLLKWFSGDNDGFEDNAEGFLQSEGLGDVSSAEIQQEVPRVFNTLQGAEGGSQLPPPPPPAEAFDGPAGGGLGHAAQTLEFYTSHYNETFEEINEGDNIVNNEGDSLVDNSVNTNIESFGDVDFEQDIENENNLALGEDSIAQSGDGTANTGNGAVVAGDDLENEGTIATGNVGGNVTGDVEDSVVVGDDVGDGNVLNSDVNDSIVGNDNEAIIDSEVGAAAFGSGDATNVDDGSNFVGGDGTIQNVGPGGDANAVTSTGSGDVAVAQQSEVDDSNIGSGSNESIDIDDSNVAFGGGDAGNTDVDIDDVDGPVQVATGDDNTQTALNDESFNAEDSFNTDNSVEVEDSFNVEDNLVAEDSFNPTEVDVEVEDSLNDNDVLDVN